jgi:threonine dehydratase
MNITLEEFKVAYSRIKPLMKETKLENFKDNIYLKRESNQVSGSFKWSGVLYAVIKIFDKILKEKIINCYLVTQSTGNHGIATLKAINLMINNYSKKYPNEKDIFNSITPIIFTNKWIRENKLNKMKIELSKYKNNKGAIYEKFNNYEESLLAREDFLKKNNAFYVAHGSKDILTGYGAIAFEIDKQIPKNKKISFYAAIGAGGPIGIGLCLSYLRDTKINIVQTKGFDAFIRSLNNNRIEYNNKNMKKILVSDGIAVDKPEIFSLEIAKKIVNKKIIVEEEEVFNLKEYKLGDSSKIALLGLLNNPSDNADYKIILDCEGN